MIFRHVHDVTYRYFAEHVQRQWQNNAVPALYLFSKLRAPLAVRYIKPGAIVVPGLSDSHAHILEYGSTLQLPLEGTKTINETVARVRNYILSNADIRSDKSKFVLGGGWDHTSWPNGAWPTAADLDSDPVIHGRPVVLQSKDCHALWVSQRALDSSLPFPEEVDGGLIIRDDSGKPTGMLLDNAQELVNQPKLLEDDLLKRFNSAIQAAVRYGLTSIHDAGLDPVSLNLFKKEAGRRTLPIRIYGMSYFDENGEYWGNTTKPIIASGHERLTARSVKIFADGALRTGGAALYEPYADNPQTSGFMRLDKEVLFQYIPLFLRDGWQVNIHSIGDRANGIVLDAFQASLSGVNVTALRPRLEHAQIMTKSDMLRLGKLGVIASIQPTHAISDMLFAEDRLGPERVKNLYAFRTLIESGARITLGSDSPVEDLNPLAGFYAAISRLTPGGDSPHGPDGWFPEQRLTREEALRGMTIDPAYASFTESILGSLEVGKRADYVVLSQNIMTIPLNEILSTQVLATAVDGDLVYGTI
ncbi:amidohydrolase 3 [Gymnopus androsaceus JB14]|uniref:Amidohydrolase 3 n=1 Tax=Gymnopus androsaceus JB14 TaxID=1447944 RepID=A0A6A4HXI2_9AGAR|nr:amidohydrolase 3 [Gymnopus androsaceus JB14]